MDQRKAGRGARQFPGLRPFDAPGFHWKPASGRLTPPRIHGPEESGARGKPPIPRAPPVRRRGLPLEACKRAPHPPEDTWTRGKRGPRQTGNSRGSARSTPQASTGSLQAGASPPRGYMDQRKAGPAANRQFPGRRPFDAPGFHWKPANGRLTPPRIHGPEEGGGAAARQFPGLRPFDAPGFHWKPANGRLTPPRIHGPEEGGGAAARQFPGLRPFDAPGFRWKPASGRLTPRGYMDQRKAGRAAGARAQTGRAVVLKTVRSAKLDCICATPGRRVRCWRWMRAKSSVLSATTLRM
jgi:hypothetical protein